MNTCGICFLLIFFVLVVWGSSVLHTDSNFGHGVKSYKYLDCASFFWGALELRVHAHILQWGCLLRPRFCYLLNVWFKMLSVCVCVCVCVCVSVSVCECMCVCVCGIVCASTCESVHVRVRVCVKHRETVCVCVCVCFYVCVCLCVCLYMCVCACVCECKLIITLKNFNSFFSYPGVWEP
jgi:hypothetical protein